MKKQTWKIPFQFAMIFALVLSMLAPAAPVGKAAAALTVADAIALNNPSSVADVEGYIVGTTASGPVYSHGPTFTVNTNIAIADSPTETDKAKIMPVQLPTGTIRDTVNLVNNSSNLGKKIRVTGTLKAYFSVPGMNPVTALQFVAPANQTSPVTASLPSGAVLNGTEISLNTGDAGAAIYYTTDGSAPTASSTPYTAPIKVESDTAIKAIAVAEGKDASEAVSFTYTVPAVQDIAGARILAKGTPASIIGTVTAIFSAGGKNNVYIQDGTAGIIVRGTALDTKVKAGDEIKAAGTMNDYNGMPQLEVAGTSAIEMVKVNAGVPDPQTVVSTDLKEETEGELVTIKHVTVHSKDTNGNYSAIDAAGTAKLKPMDAFLLETGKTYDSITGVVDYNFGEYKIVPRDASDVIEDSSKVQAVTANPAAGYVKTGTEITLSTTTKDAEIHYTEDGSEPTASSKKYTGPLTITKDSVIKAVAIKAGMTDSEAAAFDYEILDGPIQIHHIQGASHTSPLDGKNVVDVQGVVTHVVDNNNFFMQDPNPDADVKTSEGILVYKSNHGMIQGDLVKVSGQVKEYHLEGYAEKAATDAPVTEISASAMTKVSGGAELPAPVVIGKDRIAPEQIIDNDGMKEFDPEQDGLDFYESLEGMRVGVEDAKLVAPQSYGELVVVPGTVATNTANGGLRATKEDSNPERIFIDINDEKYVAKSGDSFKGLITGVVSYSFSNYKVLTNKTSLPNLVEGTTKREVVSFEKIEDQLTVASYNVENFSAKDADEKVTKVANAVVENLKQPDVIGLTEMQDNDGPADSGQTASNESAQKLIDKIKALGGPEYTYVDIAPENNKDGGQPGGNIRVAFLYNKDRVSLAAGTKGTSTQAVGFENGSLTVNPGRIDPTNEAFTNSRKPLAAQFEFQGKKVILVANHFNSKGGDQPLFGKNQPPVLGSEVQRHKIAGILNSFVKDVKAKDPNANLILLGDFNDFEFSKTFEILKGSEMSNMVEKISEEKRFSYVYQGNSQVLDHILVSNNMADSTKAEIVHINSSFMEQHGRASDHDPLMIQTQLKGKPIYSKIYKLKGFKTKKLTIEAANSYVEMDASSVIENGIVLKAKAAIKGEGLKNTKVTLLPSANETAFDFMGSEIKEAVIGNPNVSAVYGTEKVTQWTAAEGIDLTKVKFYHSDGTILPAPSVK
ncbi:chitobiase/beta-hexosaminidase C-terminal domain-containing protein [Bacillus sp. SJS]|uniref:chitobiase/beta-hexosaminidase C-terminal domain-containing protein n=1 Tax=Bacillus sp. SJS TaxID=1423321 RepID=UPI000690A2B9|nr:chitobiase/beta-hexosaminidase C-terminal domain-containing protein [Bacillus sp. SJS]KZZ84396.1 endonuclease [Bacillus sp. SJS]